MGVQELIRQWNIGTGLVLTEPEAKELLCRAGISVAESVVAHSVEEAVVAAASLGFPTVVRPVARHAANGGSPLLISRAEVRKATRKMLSSGQMEGVSVKRAARPGIELMIAVEQDPLFGPVLAFGFGRLAVQVWEDVAYRVVPLVEKDARLIIREPKGQRLLQGYEGLEAPQTSLVEQTLLLVSRLMEENPEIWRLELSPVYAYRDQVVVMDAGIELRKPGAASTEHH